MTKARLVRWFRFGILFLGILLVAAAPRAAEPSKDAEKGKPNRLAKESSPYLLQHAHNPVDWYPWGQEAFEKAKKEKKIVFLSIGYSSCHWCHVMEKDSFENKEVADYLNKHFVCIKVDREERPDVDDIYMTALHVMDTRGGWPLSMFLTPDGKPIVGGTFWPREDREIDKEKVNGFKTILKKIQEVWDQQPKEVAEQADYFAKKTSESLEMALRGSAIVGLDRSLANGAALSISDTVDPVHGGIGNKGRRHQGTKFPQPTAIGLLLDHAVREKDDDLRKLVLLTLDKMALGGIYDQIGGGFHRYSTERTWTVPHFEKMLYDNAQLVELYADAYRLTKNPLYARIIRETLVFIHREMTSPSGGFYSALDADSNGQEGEFYVWTPEEIDKALGDKADVVLLRAVYGVTGAPNFEERCYILKLSRPLEEIAKEQKLTKEELDKKLAALKVKMLEYRGKRPRPFLDTKILTAWNGQMIAGLAKAGEVLKEPEYIATAARAADFILKNCRTPDGRLLRTCSIKPDGKPEAKLNAYLDDYAFFIHGLLNLHEATGEKRWLDEAKALADLVVKWHGDSERGGYFYTSSDHEKLFARPKEYYDGAQPSANGFMARNLVRLSLKLKDDGYRKLAEKAFRQFAGILRSNPSSAPGLCFALQMYLDGKVETPPKKELGKDTPRIPKTEEVVKMTVSREKPANGKQVVTIRLSIEKPWHIYANPTGNPKVFGQTTVTLRVNGKAVDADIEYPEGEMEIDKDTGNYLIYQKEAVIKATIAKPVAADVPIDVTVKVQACTSGVNGRCLMPTDLKTTVK
jgi:uncharacterized protein YyaL (SSP411 family)